MPFCPNCGSYISPGTNICSCGTTFGYSSKPEKERESTEFERQQEEKRKVRNSYYQKAKKLMDDGRYLEAIEYIDKALETSESSFYIMAKAKAYYYAGMYDNALLLFKQSISSYHRIDDYVIFEWIGDTLIELNRFDEAIGAYKEAINIINEEYERSINFFKSERWMGYERIERACDSALKEKNERLSNVKERISYSNKLKTHQNNKKPSISAKSSFECQKEFLTSIGKQNLITITGTHFYDNPKFEKGMKFKLVKEEDNKFDSDAIAVYLNDVKVGYVANNDHTACYLTSKASDLHISDIANAEYLSYYSYMYHIAKLI